MDIDAVTRAMVRGRGSRVVVRDVTAHHAAQNPNLMARIVNQNAINPTDLADPATGKIAFMWGVNSFDPNSGEDWIMI